MCWQVAEKSEFGSLKRFLSERESGCVSLSARFKALSFPFVLDSDRSVIIVKRGASRDRIHGAVLITQNGLVLPVFDEAGLATFANGLSAVREMFSRFCEILHSIMGTTESVAAMQEVFPITPSDSVEYFLMSITPANFIPPGLPACGDCIIRRATVSDVEKIFPLQKEYELEEVFLDPGRWNERFSLANLKQALKREIVLVAETGGAIVAKAGTNARGFTFEQIGGVYTVREMRRRGIARFLVGALLENIFGRRMNAALFVKKSNPGAITLYRELGFELVDNFRIAYYFNNARFHGE
jgi:predicted GNAT family acetyltransferase